MAFRFSLETVLRLRRSLEDAERLRLQGLLAQRAQLERENLDTVARRALLNAKLKQRMQDNALPGGEMQFAAQRLRACGFQVERLQAAAASLAQPIARQQTLLLRLRMDRRALEQVRERQLARHEAELRRRSQQQVEELFLLRRMRGSE